MIRRVARLAIAIFVVAFAIVVGLSLHKAKPRQGDAPRAAQTDPTALITSGPGRYSDVQQGKSKYDITFGSSRQYENNLTKLGDGVRMVLPDKGGRTVTIKSQDATVSKPPDKQVGKADFSGGVTITTSDGITVKSATASYDDATQMTSIPGPIQFTRGRMRGSGVGGTYDHARNILWILDRAQVDAAPDDQGNGAVHVTAKAAGMARSDHYMHFTGGAHFDGEAHVIATDDAMAYLTSDDDHVQRMELRGNSHVNAKPGGTGPQDMSARDIDMAYAPDGKTLQSTHLVDGATVQLPGDAGKPGRRVAGKTIDVALAPDGSTVTNLTANENVVVDLPADGDLPARRIRAAALVATGPPTGGIQAATFTGNVDYRENRPATGKLAALDRTAKSVRLDVQTKPGFGDIEKAQFHNSVHFTDGTDTAADSPYALYAPSNDSLELTPGDGDNGLGPHVKTGRMSVDARTILLGLADQSVKADTHIRSLMIPEQPQPAPPAGKPAPPAGKPAPPAGKPAASGAPRGGRGTAVPPLPPAPASAANATHVPSIFKDDKPVAGRSNRLDYDGANSIATYEGAAEVWQDDTTIKADTIVIEDKTGNLHAITNVGTSMMMTPAAQDPNGPKPAAPAKPEPTRTKADDMLYEDAKHCATYTGSAHMDGPQGDIAAHRLELYTAAEGGQLERVEADGEVVSREVLRRSYGQHMTYIAADDSYTMTGAPVKVYDDQPPDCKLSTGASAVFHKLVNTAEIKGSGSFPHTTVRNPCGTGGAQ